MLSDECPEDQFNQLVDALAEHDPDDPAFGDPAQWPAWTDDGTWSLTSEQELEDLRRWEIIIDGEDYVATPEDWSDYSAWARWQERVTDYQADF